MIIDDTKGVGAVLKGVSEYIDSKVSNIDTSDLAKQGDNPDATNTAILEAFNHIDFSALSKEVQVKDGDDTVIAVTKAIQNAVGSAPSGSKITTLFTGLTAIYEYLVGQTPEEIPEGLGDRINLLLQFFGLPQALPEYQSMTVTEVTDYLEEIMQNIDIDLTPEKAAEITK